MKIVIFGSTGKTGLEITKQAFARGHQVTAFFRDPAKMPLSNDHLTTVTGDVYDLTSVQKAIKGKDAVICTLGSRDLKKTSIRTIGTKNIIQVMNQTGVQRLIVVSAMGIGESWQTLSFLNKLFFATVLKSSRTDHEAQEAAVKASDLDWTIIRPSGLTDTSRTSQYQVGENIQATTSTIARADVADFILNELDSNSWIGKAVTVTN